MEKDIDHLTSHNNVNKSVSINLLPFSCQSRRLKLFMHNLIKT